MVSKASNYINGQKTIEGFSYRSSAEFSCYGTTYALLTLDYLGARSDYWHGLDTLLNSQDPETGYFVEPALKNWSPSPGAHHDREHLLLHTTCAILPLLAQAGVSPLHPLSFSDAFRGDNLGPWLANRDLKNPWLEGNNLLFAGQIMLHMIEVGNPSPALKNDFERLMTWLDERVDPKTGLWGTDLGASVAHGVYGGYHQLLLYYYTNRKLPYPERLVDSCLGLQALDGSYSPEGDGGACEDVDTVDILVNLYKRCNYRRSDIRWSLKQCARHLLEIQNEDGGFPYCRKKPFTHNGLKGTEAGPGESTVFATWFRVHTLALIAEILPEIERLFPNGRQFNRACSMGWHDPTLLAPPCRDGILFPAPRCLMAQVRNAVAEPSLVFYRRCRGKIRSMLPSTPNKTSRG